MLPNEPVYVLFDIGVLLKALVLPKDATDDAKKFTEVNALQLLNAWVPMYVAFGKLAEVNALQLLNA